MIKTRSNSIKFVGLIHFVIMVLAYTSPFWLDWKLIALGIIIYYLQIWILGGCVLTYAQYGRWDETFSGNLIIKFLDKFKLKIQKEKIKKLLGALPLIYLAVALIYQVLLKAGVLVKIDLF